MENEEKICTLCTKKINDGGGKVALYNGVFNELVYICDDCISNLVKCKNCGTYYSKDAASNHVINQLNGSDTLCTNCFGDNYDDGFDGRCAIDGYHNYRRCFEPKKVDDENPKYYIGFENETEEKDNNISRYFVAEKLRSMDINKDLLFANDNSLDEGIEIISNPITLNYLIKNKDVFKNIFDKAIMLGMRSDETQNCGLHFHISKTAFGNDEKTQNNNINKLILFTLTYKNEIEKIARRKSNHFCQFLASSDENGNVSDKVKDLTYINSQKHCAGRYQVVNLENSNTIELRIFKGTLNFNTFLATFIFVNNLIELITTWSLTNISFNDVIKYGNHQELIDYAKTRNAKNGKRLKDYGLDKAKKEKTASNKIKKMVDFRTIVSLSKKLLNLGLLSINYVSGARCEFSILEAIASLINQVYYLKNTTIKKDMIDNLKSSYLSVKNNIDNHDNYFIKNRIMMMDILNQINNILTIDEVQ